MVLDNSNRIFRLSLACVSVLSSFGASAFYTATSFNGAAQLPIVEIHAEMGAGAVQLSAAINLAATQVVNTQGSGTVEVVKAISAASSNAAQENIQFGMVQTKNDMGYKAEMVAQQQRDRQTGVRGLRKEHVIKVREILAREDLADKTVPEIIMWAEENVDGHTSLSTSLEVGDPVEGCTPELCGVEFPLYSANIIDHYAVMCDSNKAIAVDRNERQQSTTQTQLESAAQTIGVISSTPNSDKVAERTEALRESVCIPADKELGLCGADIDNEEYVAKMLANEIIPNGEVSASNFYSPSAVGGAGYIDKNNPEIEDLVSLTEYESLDRDGVDGVIGLPPVQETYRNVNQLKAASGFVDNIISIDTVSNQNPTERGLSSSAQFQAAFIARTASLSMARSSFERSIAERRGTVLSSIDITGESPDYLIKEREDGAGSLDRLRFKIDENIDKFSGENIEKVAEMSEKALLVETVQQMLFQNSLAYEELLRLEKQELLLSTLLAQEVNSPENRSYLQNEGGM
ncbi:conserved exported hypothetical protein [Vibrio chagasii]|nr:conserved exported hypothetical protein [Vibrio chagasii]